MRGESLGLSLRSFTFLAKQEARLLSDAPAFHIQSSWP